MLRTYDKTSASIVLRRFSCVSRLISLNFAGLNIVIYLFYRFAIAGIKTVFDYLLLARLIRLDKTALVL